MSEPGATGLAGRSRVSSEQLDTLLSFMEEHPEFAFGKQSVYSRFSASKLWRLLAERLNAHAADTGGARKSPDKWCRYWADIKYRARRKSLARGALGELSHQEERLRELLHATRPRPRPPAHPAGAVRGGSHSDDERKPGLESGGSEDEAGGAGGGAGGEDEALGTEELLGEAAMRSALAQEKTAEAAGQAVLLLRELVDILRARGPPHPPHPPAPHPPHQPDHLMHHAPHHHRL